MRNLMLTAALAIGCDSVVRGQSTGPALSAYESLPVSASSEAWVTPPGLERQIPALSTISTTPLVEMKLAEPEVELVSHNVTQTSRSIDCGDAVLPPLGSESIWFASMELMMMSPSIPSALADIEASGFVAPRWNFGWESSRNLGLRGRVMTTTAQADVYLNGVGPLDMEISPTRVDFDVYRRFLIDDSSLLVGAGVTAAEMEFEIEPVAPFRDRGAGVQFFAEGRHRLGRSSVADLTLLARGRWASLSGEWEAPDSNINVSGNGYIEILEAAFGLEWRRRFSTADLILQCSMESQTWQSTYTEEVSLLGTVFSVGFAR